MKGPTANAEWLQFARLNDEEAVRAVIAFATNVVVYAFAKDEAEIAIAKGILEKQPTISVQVISEFLNVCRTKLGMDIPTRHKLPYVHSRPLLPGIWTRCRAG